MTAQSIHHRGPISVPNTVKGIRTALLEPLRAVFQTELDDAVDSGDMAVVDAVKGRWWAQAVWHADPSINEAFAALDCGDGAGLPSPFAAGR